MSWCRGRSVADEVAEADDPLKAVAAGVGEDRGQGFGVAVDAATK
jgi:hypothetical protein